MAISNLNPVRLVSCGFKAPAPSIARGITPPAAPFTHGVDTGAVRRAGSTGDDAKAVPRPIEPMLLLHQEQAKTIRLVFDAVNRAIRNLTGRATSV